MAEYVAKIQQGKVDAVSELKEMFGGISNFIFTDYRGLSVEQITELRNQLRNEKSLYKDVKNRYMKIALNELEQPDASNYLVGPTAVAFSEGDLNSVAKILFDFAKNNPVEVKGGIIEGGVFDAQQVEMFSKLPSKDQLLSKLMGTLKAPVQNVVFVLNGIPQKLVRTLQAVKDQKEQAGE